jgi:hypothetical protein
MSRFSLQILREVFVRRIWRDTVASGHTSSCQTPVILVRSQRNLNFPNRFLEKYISHWMQIRAVGAQLFHADRQTDGANNRFSQIFEGADKKRK